MIKINKEFEKLVQIINLFGDSPCSILNAPIGNYFLADPFLVEINEIIQKNLLVNNFSSFKNINYNEELDCFLMELKENLQLQTRLEIFLLIYNKLFNVYINDIIPSFKPVLKKVAELFSIDKYTVDSIKTFYSNQNLNDTHDSFYIVGSNFNPLRSANGAKVNYSGSNNKMIYLKLISNFDILLVKEVNVFKRYSQLMEEFEISSINLVDGSKFPEWIKCDLSYNDLILELSKPTSTNAIEILENESFPYIKLDPINGKISIEGVSIPISPLSYLDPILDWVDLYCSTNKSLEINLSLNHFNTYTTKFLMRLIGKCNDLNNRGFKVVFYWNYLEDDADLKESGEFYKEFFGNKPEFQLVSIA